MNFTHYDLGDVRCGQSVEISLTGNAANVRLLDQYNFERYKDGLQYGYIGGLTKQSPVLLQVPSNGRWHVVIDMKGLKGTVKTSFKLSKEVQPVKSSPVIVERGTKPQVITYDIFVIYAGDELDVLANPLKAALAANGVKVRADGMEMGEGASLRHMVDIGLAKGKMGVVILSPALVALSNPDGNKEIFTRTLKGEQLVALVRYNLSNATVASHFPAFIGVQSYSPDEYTTGDIAGKISRTLKVNKLLR